MKYSRFRLCASHHYGRCGSKKAIRERQLSTRRERTHHMGLLKVNATPTGFDANQLPAPAQAPLTN